MADLPPVPPRPAMPDAAAPFGGPVDPEQAPLPPPPPPPQGIYFPERRTAPWMKGGFHMSRDMDTWGEACNGWDGTLDWIVGNQIYLLRLYIHLSKQPGELDRSRLCDGLLRLFEKLREYRVGLIPRFYYDGGEADFGLMQHDLNVLTPILSQGRDVIMTIQAGFLGAQWGEWWGGRHAPDSDHGRDARVKEAKMLVVQSLLNTGIPVSLRYPRDIANFFQNIPLIGWHNDAVLAQGPQGADAGTFDKGSKLWPDNALQAAQHFARTAIPNVRGGESCEDAGKPPRVEWLLEFIREYRLCYLNVEYPGNIRGFFDDPTWGPQLRDALEQNYEACCRGAFCMAPLMDPMAGPDPHRFGAHPHQPQHPLMTSNGYPGAPAVAPEAKASKRLSRTSTLRKLYRSQNLVKKVLGAFT